MSSHGLGLLRRQPSIGIHSSAGAAPEVQGAADAREQGLLVGFVLLIGSVQLCRAIMIQVRSCRSQIWPRSGRLGSCFWDRH
jgi:hypothetical protein